jgi:transposase
MTELEQLREENQKLREQLAERDARIALLEQKIDLLIRQLYGAKSEKLNPAQLELLFGGGLGKVEASAGDNAPAAEASETAKAEGNQQSRSRESKRPRIPDHLPVVEDIIIPDCVNACPDAWRCIGEEISEQLDFEPPRFLRRRIIRRKYVRRADPERAPVIAPLPSKLVERGIAAPGLLAHIAISKFQDHLPLYRQEQIYAGRYGVQISRQTMARWMEVVADWLKPIYLNIRSNLPEGGYLQVDETPVKYLKSGTKKAQQGYLWTYHVPGGDTVFDWQSGRGNSCLAEVIPDDFRGTIQCDAYRAYQTFAANREGITLAGCWAHARRKFYEALPVRDAAGVLSRIAALYQIEARLRQRGAGPDERLFERQVHSLPLLLELYQQLESLAKGRNHLPKSRMGKAVSYALEQWKTLQVYTTDGRIEIDNNLCENQIRPTAIGKKNWLFIGGQDTGWRSAVIYTLVACCRNRGIEPYGYLKAVLEILPHATNWQIPQLTPAAWATRAQVGLELVA